MPGARGPAFRQAPRVGVPLLSRDVVGIEGRRAGCETCPPSGLPTANALVWLEPESRIRESRMQLWRPSVGLAVPPGIHRDRENLPTGGLP